MNRAWAATINDLRMCGIAQRVPAGAVVRRDADGGRVPHQSCRPQRPRAAGAEPQTRASFENLALAYLRLAEQAIKNAATDIFYETPSALAQMQQQQQQQHQQQQPQLQQAQQQQTKNED